MWPIFYSQTVERFLKVLHVLGCAKYHFFHYFRTNSLAQEQSERQIVPSHIPEQEDSGLGRAEYLEVLSHMADISNPESVAGGESLSRKKRGKYEHYSNEQRIKIGKYVLENGNKRARQQFLSECPQLKENSIWNLKKAYQKIQNEARGVSVLTQACGRPPFLLQLDAKLLQFLKAVTS